LLFCYIVPIFYISSYFLTSVIFLFYLIGTTGYAFLSTFVAFLSVFVISNPSSLICLKNAYLPPSAYY